MGLFESHDCGVLLTPDMVGQTLYSHAAACKGELLELHIDKVGYTHTKYHRADNTAGAFCTGNQGKGAKNWEAIDLEIAAQEIATYHAARVKEAEEALAAAVEAKRLVMEKIDKAAEKRKK